MKTLKQHLDPKNGVKRILSLDGGGIRGALTLGYLEKIESIVKSIYPKYRLCDYFDLIGGTSTGAIIAAGLSIGLSVKEIREKYLDIGSKIFQKKRKWWNLQKYLKASYDDSVLNKKLQDIFGDILIGDHEIKTGLCIIAKRADTNSIWPVINHPKGKFYNSPEGKNKNIPLWQMVRASCAAPSYFKPQKIQIGGNINAPFIDGGVSMANNPALTLLMVATLKGFPFKWKLSEKKLSLISVGTGHRVFNKLTKDIDNAWLYTWAKNVPNMLMQDASWQNQIILQWLSKSKTPKTIDMEIGDLNDDLIAGKSLINYLRYDFSITNENLNNLNLPKKYIRKYTNKDITNLIEMSNAENRFLLYQIGKKAGEKEVLIDHFKTKP